MSRSGPTRARRRRAVWRRLGTILRPAAIAIGLFVLAGPPIGAIVFAVVPPGLTPLMMVRMIEGEGYVRVPVGLEDISPHLVRAVIAAEDARFCRHHGIDWQAVRAAFAHNTKGSGLRGASTISMQTARNLLLWPGRSWLRKGLEGYTTVFVEAFWSKRRIARVYLNIVEWGPGLYGAEAAARYHFGTTAARLNADQAARLAVILPAPRQWRANPPGGYVSERAQVIRARMETIRTQGLDRCVLG